MQTDRPLTDAEQLLPAHLGGHQNMTWIDESVLDYLIARYRVRTMLDIGCGPGGMVDLAEQRGLEVWGVDGDPTLARDGIATHDFTMGPLVLLRQWELIWCVEFVEHVEQQYQENYLATFDAGRVLFLTAAYPGQGGHHHVNEQPSAYWIDLLQSRGWALDDEATEWVRHNGATPFAKMTGMVFVK